MSKHRVRSLKPQQSEWIEVEADGVADAAQVFHDRFEHHYKSSIVTVKNGDGQHQVWFMLVEVDGYGELVSRIYHYGIWRKGGVGYHQPTIQERLKIVAKEIGWQKDPGLLLEEDWAGEESMDDAMDRRYES